MTVCNNSFAYAWFDYTDGKSKYSYSFCYGPSVLSSDGTLFYYHRGVCSRRNGPAIVKPNGIKEYWLRGRRHREDGPAIIEPNGYKAYYLNNEEYEELQYYKKMRNRYTNSVPVYFKK